MKIIFNKNAVKYTTDKALLIKVPRSKFCVWVPASLTDVKLFYFTAYLPEDMTFTLVHNKEKKYCSAETLQAMFSSVQNPERRTFKTVYKPTHIKPKKVSVDESLKR